MTRTVASVPEATPCSSGGAAPMTRRADSDRHLVVLGIDRAAGLAGLRHCDSVSCRGAVQGAMQRVAGPIQLRTGTLRPIEFPASRGPDRLAVLGLHSRHEAGCGPVI